MSKTITEAELHTIDLAGFCEALLISEQEDEVGVLAYEFRRMAPMCGPNGEGKPVANQLKVVVDDPDNHETLVRVAAILTSRLGQ
ncbi:hypothetical protein [Pseudomonas mosselii]|uniref:hypothetical protein n=1 Tax=Pseudomonas mosselii TaxID=78327 RepID=UPI0016440C0C|nr:hypothetical protein [Pseudomonas mosselii]MBC3456305.1 hypothetical protein [Pseudomonas mosselii]